MRPQVRIDETLMNYKCEKHPEREGKFYCAKYNKYLCDECMKCQDPTLYCKHRSSCIIWELYKHGDDN